VDRSGLDVAARDTYCTSALPASRVLKPSQRALEERVARGATGNVTAGMQLSWFYSQANEAVVDLAMDIDPRAMKLHGKLHGEINLSGAAYRPDGTVAIRFGDTVEMDFDTPAQLEAFLKVPYHYATQFGVVAGRYRFRMALGSGDQAFGSVEKMLDIEPWNGDVLAVSGIALSVKDYPVTGIAAELENGMLEGHRRLASKGRSIVPMGGTGVAVGQNGLFYFEVYEPRTGNPPALRIRILDRATGDEKNDSGVMNTAEWVQAGNPTIPIALNLPASNLPAGSYTLEIRVIEAEGQATAMRSMDFEVK
jgi:hypothetical protein